MNEKRNEFSATDAALERVRRIMAGEKEEYTGIVPLEAYQTLAATPRGIRRIPLELIDPWEDAENKVQPFKPYPPEKLRELADNMAENGQLSPVRLRPSPFTVGRFQTLAGHNRIAAAKLLGWSMIDAITDAVDDDQARLILVDSNLQQREKLLPSEKAWAYKLRLDTLKHQGKRTDLTSCNDCTKFRSDQQAAHQEQISARTIQYYICLTRLLPSLLDMVDNEAMPLMAGVAVSFLSSAAQETLLRVLRVEGITSINRSQGEALKEIRDLLDGKDAESLILRIFGRGSAKRPPKAPVWKFETLLPAAVVKRYSKDAELQARVSETIRRYIEEQESRT